MAEQFVHKTGPLRYNLSMSLSRPQFLGCHVSSSGGLASALQNAQELGVNTIQLHPSAPQRWTYKPFAPDIEAPYLEVLPSSGVQQVFFHGIYLINLANPDPQKLGLSRMSLVHYLDLCHRIGGAGVIFHVGSNAQQPDEESGFRQAAEAINRVLSDSKNSARLILEVAAGAGSVIGDRLEELAAIYSLVEVKERVGFGLDTQHMWASGYNWQESLDEIVGSVEKILGLEKVWSIHLNDSKTACGSKKDRHENLGQGLIGKAALQAVVQHAKLRSIPMILETPDLETLEGAKREVAALKDLAGAGA